ncbi:MAG: bidirectional hydrogenase complex protein HoxU [Chloroflexota bacterium]
MTRVLTLKINDLEVSGREDETILELARENSVRIPTLCQLEGLSNIGACRLCLVEVKGVAKLLPACTTLIVEGMEVFTDSERLQKYRRMTIEMLFAEGNHVCSVCVTNGHCELQNLAVGLGIDHISLPYMNPRRGVDASHERFAIDHNRCVLCTRCIRVCAEVEGAHTWDMMGRGSQSCVITDLHQPWGDALSCTSCGKCVQVCPTGALFIKGKAVGEMTKHKGFLVTLAETRENGK